MVQDANGCTKTASVIITQPATLLTTSILSSTDENCFGNNSGIATVGASGGDPAYTYLWSAGSQSQSTATGLSAGTYTVAVTDSAGCTVTSSVSITQPNAIAPTPTIVSATCINNDGSISLAMAGGTTPYTYQWSPVTSTSSSISGLSAGNYKVIITDAHGCLDTVTITVPLDSTFNLKITGLDTICKGVADTLTASGATTYLWSNGNTSSTLIVSPTTGPVTFWVTGTTGVCTDSIPHTITIYKPLGGNMPKKDTICPGKPVTLKVNVGGGKPKYNYVWNNGITNDSPGPFVVYPVDSTTYIVTITDGCNDLFVDSTIVDILPKGNVNFTISPDTIPGGQTVNFTGSGTNITSWYWTFGDGTTSTAQDPGAIYTNPGTYVVTLIGDNIYGCPDTVTRDVYVTPEILIPNVFTPNGDATNDIFYFTITGTTCFHCEIFNRWGVLIYVLNSEAEGWPGIIRQTNEKASDGVYYYILSYCDYMNITHKLDGFIQLIRK
jgi:gliding motility-associated-like protein